MIGCIAALALLLIFLFQRLNYVELICQLITGTGTGLSKTHIFLINRFLRFLINDFFAILLIYALFQERKYVLFGIVVQAIGFILIFIPYAFLRLYYPEINGALVSFLHRLIINPTLLLLLIPILFYQKKLQKHSNNT